MPLSKLQMRELSRREIVEKSVASSRCIIVPAMETAIAVSNDYAPERLILQVREPRKCAASDLQRGLGVPRPVDARADGRLLLRHEPRVADGTAMRVRTAGSRSSTFVDSA